MSLVERTISQESPWSTMECAGRSTRSWCPPPARPDPQPLVVPNPYQPFLVQSVTWFLLLRKMLFRQHVLCFVLSIPFCAVLIVRIVIPASLLLGLSRCCGWVMDVFNAVHPDVQLPASSLFSSHLLGSLLSPATPAVQTGSLQAATGSEGGEYCIGKAVGWRKMLKALARLGVRVFF